MIGSNERHLAYLWELALHALDTYGVIPLDLHAALVEAGADPSSIEG